MNEQPPSQPPATGPNPAPDPLPDGDAAPSFWAMFGLGIVLFIGSCILCAPFQNPFPFGIGALVAFITLFFRGYRGIFVGYLATIGVIILVATIICGVMGTPRFN